VPYPNKFHQYVPVQRPAPYVRFGWFGGAQHIEDVALMEKSMKMLCNDKSLNGKYTVTLGGYNDNPSYNFYERIFSNRGNNKYYNRIPARSVYEYMYGYNDVDVAYAPVNKTEFNRSRSELKVVEAGWMGKTLICSDMDYYKEHIKHGYNGFIVSKAEESGWYRYTRELILDKDLREGMQKNLQEYVLKNFQFPEIFAKKANLYLRAYRENSMENRIQNLIDNGTITITEPGATTEPTEGSTEA
jgi:glycosyltransferase involved in cell wall biosynthesis